MEDEKLRSLFSDFEPEMADDGDFMARLEQGMKAVDAVRQDIAREKASHRRSLVVALAAGFIAGCVFSTLVPYLTAAVATLLLTLPDWGASLPSGTIAPAMAWLAVAATSTIVGLNAYDLTAALVRRRI